MKKSDLSAKKCMKMYFFYFYLIIDPFFDWTYR